MVNNETGYGGGLTHFRHRKEASVVGGSGRSGVKEE